MGRRGLGFTAGCWLARRVPDCIDLSLYRTVLHLYELYMYNMGMRGGGQTARLRTDSDWAACPYAFPPIVRRLLSAVTNALKERREQLETHPQAAFCWRKIVDGENSIHACPTREHTAPENPTVGSSYHRYLSVPVWALIDLRRAPLTHDHSRSLDSAHQLRLSGVFGADGRVPDRLDPACGPG